MIRCRNKKKKKKKKKKNKRNEKKGCTAQFVECSKQTNNSLNQLENARTTKRKRKA